MRFGGIATAALASVVATGLPVRAVEQAADVSQARVVPIQITGDAAARFSMVVMGDGYTAAEMPRFRAHLDKHLNVLWSIEPFRSYRNYINVYAVEIESAESGITCDPEVRERRNTPLGLQFGGGCTNINARGITPAQGRDELIRRYAARATPNYDQILIIANTDTYGGIGGSLATTSGGNSLGPLITPHELGHSLGRLTDEYTYSARGVAGGAYTGAEPASIHMTTMSIEDMLTKQAKWFRWLGEPSESGGKIERFEGGSQRTTGIFRPSKHSMMISVGYYFDQVSREQMVRKITEQVGLIAQSTPTDAYLLRNDVLWINPAHPVYHELQIAWKVGERLMPNPRNLPYLDLATAGLTLDEQKVTVTVVDPTPFVRDPVIRASVLTATRTWTIPGGRGPASTTRFLPGVGNAIGDHTQTERAIGGKDVVYIEPRWVSENEILRLAPVWRLDDNIIDDATGKLAFPLAARQLSSGTHRLSVSVGSVSPSAFATGTATGIRTWTIDATDPTVTATIATPLATVAGTEPHYFVRDEFTMKLDPRDDQPGYVVAEFRVNGDGWHHYYGWPDAPPGTPFKFTPRGTTIKELVYGSLASEGLSPQPWEKREPGWGTHRIEYRGIDAAGNIGAARSLTVTLEPSPPCARTIEGDHKGDVQVTADTTCLAPGAVVTGNISVSAGASLVATNARVTGNVTAAGASVVELVETTIGGNAQVTGATTRAVVFSSTILGTLTATTAKPAKPALLVGNRTRAR